MDQTYYLNKVGNNYWALSSDFTIEEESNQFSVDYNGEIQTFTIQGTYYILQNGSMSLEPTEYIS